MLTSATHDCASAALVNAVFGLRGEDAAGRVREVIDRGERPYETLKPLGEIVKKAKESHVHCRVMREIEAQAAIQKADRRVAFAFLAAKRSGVYVVRLREEACVDHALVVDANNGMIIDSEETCALRPAADVLMCCGGPRAKLLRTREVR